MKRRKAMVEADSGRTKADKMDAMYVRLVMAREDIGEKVECEEFGLVDGDSTGVAVTKGVAQLTQTFILLLIINCLLHVKVAH